MEVDALQNSVTSFAIAVRTRPQIPTRYQTVTAPTKKKVDRETVVKEVFGKFLYIWLSEAKPQSCHENRDLRYIYNYVYIVRETRPQAPVITLLTSAIFLNFFFLKNCEFCPYLQPNAWAYQRAAPSSKSNTE